MAKIKLLGNITNVFFDCFIGNSSVRKNRLEFYV